MKRTVILCLSSLLVLGVFAQKKNNLSKPISEPALINKTDSLSYALGRNMSQGLPQYLMSIKVLQDTTDANLIENIVAKMEKVDEAGKKKLEKELATKKGVAVKENSKNMGEFLEGVQASLKEEKQNNYNTGLSIGNQLKEITKKFEQEMLNGNNINKEAFAYSLVSSLMGKKSLIDNPEEYLQRAGAEMQQAEEIRKAEELQALHGERISKEVIFLAENKTKEGVVTLPSGLQYKVITEGTGSKPTPADKVTVHYEGKFLDGTVFDSSYERGEPITFGVTQVIKGWTEALQLMPVGSKWTIYIPQNLAYADKDHGTIPPYSTLVFDVELINIAQ